MPKKASPNLIKYCAVIVLSYAPNVFERIVSNQKVFFFLNESTFLPLFTGFGKNQSTQNVLLNAIEKWKHRLDKGKKVGNIFIDLSKTFDTLNDNLSLAKVNAYGFLLM